MDIDMSFLDSIITNCETQLDSVFDIQESSTKQDNSIYHMLSDCIRDLLSDSKKTSNFLYKKSALFRLDFDQSNGVIDISDSLEDIDCDSSLLKDFEQMSQYICQYKSKYNEMESMYHRKSKECQLLQESLQSIQTKYDLIKENFESILYKTEEMNDTSYKEKEKLSNTYETLKNMQKEKQVCEETIKQLNNTIQLKDMELNMIKELQKNFMNDQKGINESIQRSLETLKSQYINTDKKLIHALKENNRLSKQIESIKQKHENQLIGMNSIAKVDNQSQYQKMQIKTLQQEIQFLKRKLRTYEERK
ncbi:hypothetical protein WA158_007666 [Blastocystis sp. Blastoise]